MISTDGIVIRMNVDDISVRGRITSGVIVMDLGEKDSVASIAKVREIEGEKKADETEEQALEDALEDASPEEAGDETEE